MQERKDGTKRPQLAFAIQLEAAKKKRKPDQADDREKTAKPRADLEQKLPHSKPRFDSEKALGEQNDLCIARPLQKASIQAAALDLKRKILDKKEYRSGPLRIGIMSAAMPDLEKWQDADLVTFLSPLLEITQKEPANILPPIHLCVRHQNLFCLSPELEALLKALPIVALDFRHNPNIKWSAKNILRPVLRENDLICKVDVDIKQNANAIEKAFYQIVQNKIAARNSAYAKLAPDF